MPEAQTSFHLNRNGGSNLVCSDSSPSLTGCSKNYSDSFLLTSSESSVMFSCDECPYKSRYKHAVKRHKRIHTGAFFQCHLCTNHYSARHELHLHLKIHSGELMCRHCGKQITSINMWHEHERFHKLQKSS